MAFQKQILEIQQYRPLKRLHASDSLQSLLSLDQRGIFFIPTNSGKAALFIILSFLRQTGQIKDHLSQVLVPQWIGSWVYNVMHKLCFPTTVCPPDLESIKAILIYHQYGYPQKMNDILPIAKANGWFVIEDCAHAIESYSDGQRLGLIGDASIFSFSKFFPSLMGGAILTRNKDLALFANVRLQEHSRLVDWYSFYTKYAAERASGAAKRIALNLVEAGYNIYEYAPKLNLVSANVIATELREQSLEKRKSNRDFFLRELEHLPIFGDLSQAQVNPYILPLFCDSVAQHSAVLNALTEVGVVTGSYNFDTNRNILSPNFERCLWLPVHPGLGESQKAAIAKNIKGTF